MTIILKIIITIIILGEFIVCVFLGWRVLELMKRVKQLQEDRNKAEEDWYRLLRAKPMLENLEWKMILNALNMPQYKGAVENPQTNYNVRKAYKQLKEKIKASFGD